MEYRIYDCDAYDVDEFLSFEDNFCNRVKEIPRGLEKFIIREER